MLSLRGLTKPKRWMRAWSPSFIFIRNAGGAKCFPAVLNDIIEGAIVFTRRTLYDDSVLEFIAPMNIRERLKLKDGDRIRLKVYFSEKSIRSKSH